MPLAQTHPLIEGIDPLLDEETPVDGGGGDGDGKGGGKKKPKPEPLPTPPQSLVKIRTGAVWYKVADPQGTDDAARWYAVYTIPGTDIKYVFEATKDQVDSIFGIDQQPPGQVALSGPEWDTQMKSPFWFRGGEISEMESASQESFESAYERAVMAGLGVSGIPEALQNDQQVQALIFMAEQESWTDDRFSEEVAKTNIFKLRFPHLDAFKRENLTVKEAVSAYLEYENKTNTLAREILGKELTTAEIGAFIGKNHSFDLVKATFEQYRTMTEKASALEAFNQVLTSRGLPALSGMGYYEFMGGRAAPELYDIYEDAAILEAATASGLSFLNAGDARELAAATRGYTDYGTAYEGLSAAAEMVLRYRHELNMEELDSNDLVDLALGIAPRSGADISELGRKLTQVVSQAKGYLESRRGTYAGRSFTRQGVPKAATLSKSRPVG